MAALMLIGVAGVLGFALVGVAMLVSWSRRRRAEVVARQIALTDALHGQLGPVVAPVVRKPVWGPWEVRMAVPVLQPAAMGIIVAAVDDLFSRNAEDPRTYRLVLRVQQDSSSSWAGDRLAAA